MAHHVYFIKNKKGEIKIGYSAYPKHRVRAQGYKAKEKFIVLGFIEGGREKELELHKQFMEYRLHGEWFEAAPELLAFIENNAIPEPIRPKRPKLKQLIYFVNKDNPLYEIILKATNAPEGKVVSISIDVMVNDDD